MPPTERLTAALAGVAVGAASMVVCGSASSIFVSTQNSSAPAASDGEQEITRSDSATAPTLEDVGKLRQLYQQDGYVKLSGLLSTDEVESWRKAVDNGVREQLLRSQGRYLLRQHFSHYFVFPLNLSSDKSQLTWMRNMYPSRSQVSQWRDERGC